jgi:hypothetical protein
MIAQASNPEEQNLLTDTIGVVSGIPAINAATLCGILPAPGYKLLPTVISSILFGSILDLSIKALKTGVNNPSGGVSFNPPLFAFVNGVLKAATITTSSSFLSVIEQEFGLI